MSSDKETKRKAKQEWTFHIGEDYFRIESGDTVIIPETSLNGVNEDHIELIVKSVNNYQKLVDALEQAKKDWQWTFDNMGTPHTPDHFNIPANGINEIEQLLQTLKA